MPNQYFVPTQIIKITTSFMLFVGKLKSVAKFMWLEIFTIKWPWLDAVTFISDMKHVILYGQNDKMKPTTCNLKTWQLYFNIFVHTVISNYKKSQFVIFSISCHLDSTFRNYNFNNCFYSVQNCKRYNIITNVKRSLIHVYEDLQKDNILCMKSDNSQKKTYNGYIPSPIQ